MSSQSNQHSKWALFPDLYLATALELCDGILKRNIGKEYNFLSSMDVTDYEPDPNDYDFVFPLIYNFKHGIELYIKALGIIDYNEYLYEHDFEKLFQECKKRSRKTVNQKIIDELYKNVWGIIKKYYYGRYIPPKAKSRIADKMNTAEKYPEDRKTYKIPYIIDWGSIEIIKKIVEDIQRDIQEIQKEFSQARRKIQPTKKYLYKRIKY